MDKEPKQKTKMKKITITYNIDSFETLTEYHKSKGIAEAFLVMGIIALSIGLIGYDHLAISGISILFFFLYKFYERNLAKRLSNQADWQEEEIEVDEEPN